MLRSDYFKLICKIVKVWGAHLTDVSCFCLATDVQKQLDSVAPQTDLRLMNCDSFNKPGYEQSSCSHYISRNSCCFSRGFDFLLYSLLIEGEGNLPSHTNWLNDIVEAADFAQSEPVAAARGRNFNRAGCSDSVMSSVPANIETSMKTTNCIYVVYIDGFGGSCQRLLCNYNRLNYVWR